MDLSEQNRRHLQCGSLEQDLRDHMLLAGGLPALTQITDPGRTDTGMAAAGTTPLTTRIMKPTAQIAGTTSEYEVRAVRRSSLGTSTIAQALWGRQ